MGKHLRKQALIGMALGSSLTGCISFEEEKKNTPEQDSIAAVKAAETVTLSEELYEQLADSTAPSQKEILSALKTGATADQIQAFQSAKRMLGVRINGFEFYHEGKSITYGNEPRMQISSSQVESLNTGDPRALLGIMLVEALYAQIPDASDYVNVRGVSKRVEIPQDAMRLRWLDMHSSAPLDLIAEAMRNRGNVPDYTIFMIEDKAKLLVEQANDQAKANHSFTEKYHANRTADSVHTGRGQ